MNDAKRTGMWLVCAVVLIMAISPPSTAQPHALSKYFLIRVHTYDDFTIHYRLFVPEGYDPNRYYPAVLMLHGAGNRGNDNESHLNNVTATWADDDIQKDHPSFVIVPQCPQGSRWEYEDVYSTVFDILDSLFAEFSINQRKVYLSGLSMGAAGAWALPMARPYQFAASIPISGGGKSRAVGMISHIPFWAMHGAVDDVVPVENTRVMIRTLEQLQRTTIYTHCNYKTDDCSGMTDALIQTAIDNGAKLIYSEHPNKRHNIGQRHFDNDNVFRWLYQQEKPDVWFAAEEKRAHVTSVTIDQDHLVRLTPTPVTLDVTLDAAITDEREFNELVLDVSQNNAQGDVFVPLQEITPTFYSISYPLTAFRAGGVGLTVLLRSHSGQTYPLSYLELPSFEGFLTYGLTAYWTLDETQGEIALDSGGQNNASVMGDPIWLPDAGRVNGVLQFDGTDDALVAAAPLNPADGPFSVFLWIKGGAAGQTFLSEPDGPDWLSLDAKTGHLITGLANTGRAARYLRSEAVIADGDWHHIGFVWDGSHRTLYADGVVWAQDMQPRLESPAKGLYIGTGNTMAPGTYFRGFIDDIRIYTRELELDEILVLAQKG